MTPAEPAEADWVYLVGGEQPAEDPTQGTLMGAEPEAPATTEAKVGMSEVGTELV